MGETREHPLLKSARREALVVLIVWALTTTYCVTYCTWYGYAIPARLAGSGTATGRDPATLTFVLGFPDWIFWGIVLPWGVCTIVSTIFAFGFMSDADLES